MRVTWDWFPPAIISAVFVAVVSVWKQIDERSSIRRFERLAATRQSLAEDSEALRSLDRALGLLAKRLLRREQPKRRGGVFEILSMVVVTLAISAGVGLLLSWLAQQFEISIPIESRESWRVAAVLIGSIFSIAALTLGVTQLWRMWRGRRLLAKAMNQK